MTPETFLTDVLVPGLSWMTTVVGPKPGLTVDWQNDSAARLFLGSVAGQESNWSDVAQAGSGVARGPWQCQENDCADILFNPASEQMMLKVCAALKITPTPPTIYDAILANPATLAVALARLNLWCDPNPLPTYGNEDAGWNCYVRVWRPGAPSRARWSVVYPQALAADKAWSKTT